MTTLPDWLTRKELQEALRIGENQVKVMLRESLIPAKFIRKIGRRDFRFHRLFIEPSVVK